MHEIESVRTPDERFEDLPGFEYSPNYIESVADDPGLRMHYLDAGPRDGNETFLCLHGEPSWSYLYRKMARTFVDVGCRVVAPDLFGFGRSDKPVDDAVYTFEFHRNALLRFVDALALDDVTLVVQDWGGILGLTLPMVLGDRVKRLVIMNTTLATGEGAPSDGFIAWRDYMRTQPDPDVGRIMRRAVDGLSAREAVAYDAPFPDRRFKAGVRRFPDLVPTEPAMEGADLGRAARDYFASYWNKPTFMAVGMQDPVLGLEVMMHLRGMIPGCPEPMRIEEGGHFVQEHGEPVARAALQAFGIT
jgi:pimeloyl-ACP methyl ester carboxylesterase